jgi:lycopene cyclase CruA
VRAAGGDELLERLEHLDALRGQPSRIHAPPAAPGPGDERDVDVVLAGGGLWSLLAPLLAGRGLRVAVLERARAGQSHREWNASGPELESLVRCGLLDRAELDRLVVARYERGVCRFAGGGAYPVSGVLDNAVDAQALLLAARAKGERAGVAYLDGHTVLSHAAGPTAVRVGATCERGELTLTASVLVDARGAASPYACADLVCPTVGGVVEGLKQGDGPDEVNPRVGEILATVDAIEQGRQHVWEAFPGRAGQTTVYVFYYARTTEPVSLADLYSRFFETLGRYKRGDARLVRPTFGLIPGWSRLTPAPATDHPRVMLVGDVASRHSPLTYCGFGATLRSLARAADAVERRVHGHEGDAIVVDDAPVHALTGALARMMASRAFHGHELNELLDAAFATLHGLGDDAYAALLRDEMKAPRFVAFLRETARRHPAVWGKVMRGLGPWAAGRWGLGVARQMVGGARP